MATGTVKTLKRSWPQRLSLAIGSLFVAGAAWVLWQAGRAIATMDKDVLVAIVAAVGTAVGGIYSITATNRANKRREIAEAHRPAKVLVYSKFMKLIVQMMIGTKLAKEAPSEAASQKLAEDLLEIKRDLMAWAGPSVISSYLRLEEAALSPQVVVRMDELFRAMRKDLGMDDKGLEPGALLGLFLTNEARREFAAQFRIGSSVAAT